MKRRIEAPLAPEKRDAPFPAAAVVEVGKGVAIDSPPEAMKDPRPSSATIGVVWCYPRCVIRLPAEDER